jgi:hypothetical protein
MGPRSPCVFRRRIGRGRFALACEQHLGQCRGCFIEVKKLKSMRRILRSAISWTSPIALRNRIGWLSISGRHSLEVFAEDVPAARSLFKTDVVPKRGRCYLRELNGNSAPLVRCRHQNERLERGNQRTMKLDGLGNKARGDRVSCLAAQLGANWCRSVPAWRDITWQKEARRPWPGLGRRVAGDRRQDAGRLIGDQTC